MNVDLSELLAAWPYEPGKLNVRLIQGADSVPRIQVRLDLGILQMQRDGRPDGLRPSGFESLLEYFEAALDAAEGTAPPPPPLEPPFAPAEDAEPSSPPSDEASETDNEFADEASINPESEPDAENADVEDPQSPRSGFALSPAACRMLRDEAVQYYHRYVALLVLEDYDRVVRDTTRNLRALDLCRDHGTTDEDRNILEQFRPYITMMRARAMAGRALADDEPKAALHAIDQGLESLRTLFEHRGDIDLYDAANEVRALKSMRDELVPKLPVSQRSELRDRIRKAVENENYELAAILRDELRQLPD